MICPKCGANIIDGDNFCEDCGASLKNIRHIEPTSKDYNWDIKSDICVVDSTLAVACNIGRKHPKNEDAGTVIKGIDGACILIVADGVSSAVNATSASVQAVAKVKEKLKEGVDNDMDLMRNAINEANDIVVSLPSETRTDGIYGPETTVVAAKVTGSEAVIGWVGDSRAYIISKTSQKLLTIDDSWVELVVSSGEMTRSQAIKDKRAHYVTQVLGMHDQPMQVHIIEQKIEKDQILLLCSDGLWNYFQGDNELLNKITDFGIEKAAIEICEHLINLANNAGGHDNITVAILKSID